MTRREGRAIGWHHEMADGAEICPHCAQVQTCWSEAYYMKSLIKANNYMELRSKFRIWLKTQGAIRVEYKLCQPGLTLPPAPHISF